MDPPQCPSSRVSGDEIGSPNATEALPGVVPEASIRNEGSSTVQDVSSGTETADAVATEVMNPRAYQLEMLDQSIKQNVVVAMDTGSGKTQVAVLRIKWELEMKPSNKMAWFLAPTVALCEQQCEAIQVQNASASIRLLTGNDNVDTWSPKTWTEILEGKLIVISTYQVLLDALDHAFVKLQDISLLVVDEAHNCVGKSPVSKIMENHYYRSRDAGLAVPSILGLTASPIMKSKVDTIKVLERALDSKCVTPTLHREELLKCVKHPELSYAFYERDELASYSTTVASVRRVYAGLDITMDPYIRKLCADGSEKSLRELEKAIKKRDTFVQSQMKGLSARSTEIFRELGPWAANYYVSKAVEQFKEQSQPADALFTNWPSEEKIYLSGILRMIEIQPPTEAPVATDEISHKVKVLVQQLLSAQGSMVGIVFVKERATVTILSALLCSSPDIRTRYKIGTMVGTSSYRARRKNMYEFGDKKDFESLQKFRSGETNLLIATSVLEEGIDVPACNLVICFDQPPNLKVFIQRRGRARMRDSKLVLLRGATDKSPQDWLMLENEMKQQYEDDEREWHRLEHLEIEDTSSNMFIAEATGARLDFDNAKAHLDHFCSVVSSGEFVDFRPDYIIRHDDSGQGRLRATVQLPAFLPTALRKAESISSWKSEKNATKDAAFQAYVALYKAGFVNNHLLPFELEKTSKVDDRVPEIEVGLPYQPWYLVAQLWEFPGDRWIYPVSCFNEHGNVIGQYQILLPVQLPQIRPLKIHLGHESHGELRFGSVSRISHEEATKLPDHTTTLLALHYAHRWEIEERPHVIKVVSQDSDLGMDKIGSIPFQHPQMLSQTKDHLLRDHDKSPSFYVDMISSKPAVEQVQHRFFGFENAPVHVPYVVLKRWTKRSDFLHPVTQAVPTSTKPYSYVFPLPWTTIDEISVNHAHFGMLIPSIIHELEVMLIAKHMSTTLMQPVGLDNLDLIREAISARSACEYKDYERLEFLGDSILKYYAVVQVSADFPDWPEGYLSQSKDRLVKNKRLCRAANESRLSRFILSRPFTGMKWRPLYLDNFLGPEASGERILSTKTQADVVESLIGASYVAGGTPMAQKCISHFIQEVAWRDAGDSRNILFSTVPTDVTLPPDLLLLEELVGYRFHKKALLVEAMTHGSYITTSLRSFERLEFLGDAVLDMIIVPNLFTRQPPLPHNTMHTLKTAMVNADFLAFVGFEREICRKEAFVTKDKTVEKKDVAYSLWKFMRHASAPLGLEQLAMEQRHKALRGEILDAIVGGRIYPWALLARLRAKKLYSDLFEALIGAIWVDSGSLDVCEAVLDQFGILAYLERILRDNVHVMHPKEEIGVLAVTEKVTYQTEVKPGIGLGDAEYMCKLYVGDRLVADVKGGVKREEVQTKAAAEAVRFIKEEQLKGRWTRSD